MKYHVFISKREILMSIFFIVGLIILFNGIHSSYKYNHALNLNTLKEYELKEGAFVIGSIDTYVGQKLYGSNDFSGVSKTSIISGKAYNFYTEDLINSFVIKETNFGRNKHIIYAGVLLLAMATLLFFSAGGIKDLVMEETENAKPVYNNYAKIYNRDYGLQAEQRQLETLERRLHSIKGDAILCLVPLLVGIYIVYSAYLLEVKVFGILLILISVKGICNYFINSANTVAMFLVKKFTFKSLSIQIEEHKKYLEKLKEKG